MVEYLLKISGLAVLEEICEEENLLELKHQALENGDLDEYEKFTGIEFSLVNVKQRITKDKNIEETDDNNTKNEVHIDIAENILDTIIKARKKLEEERLALEIERKEHALVMNISNNLPNKSLLETNKNGISRAVRRASTFFSSLMEKPPPPPPRSKHKRSENSHESVLEQSIQRISESNVECDNDDESNTETANPMLNVIGKSSKIEALEKRPKSQKYSKKSKLSKLNIPQNISHSSNRTSITVDYDVYSANIENFKGDNEYL